MTVGLGEMPLADRSKMIHAKVGETRRASWWYEPDRAQTGEVGERPFGSSKTKSIGGFFGLSKRTLAHAFTLGFRKTAR